MLCAKFIDLVFDKKQWGRGGEGTTEAGRDGTGLRLSSVCEREDSWPAASVLKKHQNTQAVIFS